MTNLEILAQAAYGAFALSSSDRLPACLCWCQVRPVVCTLSCCGCIVHDHAAPTTATATKRKETT